MLHWDWVVTCLFSDASSTGITLLSLELAERALGWNHTFTILRLLQDCYLKLQNFIYLKGGRKAVQADRFISSHCPLGSTSPLTTTLPKPCLKTIQNVKAPLHLTLCKAVMLLLLPAASHPQQHLGEGAVLALYKTHNSWLLLVPTAHPSLPLFCFHLWKHLQRQGLCKHHPSKDPPHKIEFYLFQSTKKRPCRKIRSTLAALRLHQYFFSPLFYYTFCTES